MAVMAVDAGVRAGICMIAVPNPRRSVRDATQASHDTASEPYASALQMESKPRRSASWTSGMTSMGTAPQYPRWSPNFTARSIAVPLCRQDDGQTYTQTRHGPDRAETAAGRGSGTDHETPRGPGSIAGRGVRLLRPRRGGKRQRSGHDRGHGVGLLVHQAAGRALPGARAIRGAGPARVHARGVGGDAPPLVHPPGPGRGVRPPCSLTRNRRDAGGWTRLSGTWMTRGWSAIRDGSTWRASCASRPPRRR